MRELHKRKSDHKYNIWSSIVDDYLFEWSSKDELREVLMEEAFEEARDKVERMLWVHDREVD